MDELWSILANGPAVTWADNGRPNVPDELLEDLRRFVSKAEKRGAMEALEKMRDTVKHWHDNSFTRPLEERSALFAILKKLDDEIARRKEPS